jgi:hypothetical protein
MPGFKFSAFIKGSAISYEPAPSGLGLSKDKKGFSKIVPLSNLGGAAVYWASYALFPHS